MARQTRLSLLSIACLALLLTGCEPIHRLSLVVALPQPLELTEIQEVLESEGGLSTNLRRRPIDVAELDCDVESTRVILFVAEDGSQLSLYSAWFGPEPPIARVCTARHAQWRIYHLLTRTWPALPPDEDVVERYRVCESFK